MKLWGAFVIAITFAAAVFATDVDILDVTEIRGRSSSTPLTSIGSTRPSAQSLAARPASIIHELKSPITGRAYRIRGEVGTAGTLGVDYALGTHLAGGVQLGHGFGNQYSWAGGFVPPLPSENTAAGAMEATDHNWAQGTRAPVIVDLGAGNESELAIVFNSLDHTGVAGAVYADPAENLWNAMIEGVEFTVYGSNDRDDALAAGVRADVFGGTGGALSERGEVPRRRVGSSFEQGILEYVFNDGWLDHGFPQEGDDFASVWSFASPQRFIAVYSNRTDPFLADGFRSDDNELDAIGRFLYDLRTETPIPTITPTPSPTNTPSPTPTSTPSPTSTPTPTPTLTPTLAPIYMPASLRESCPDIIQRADVVLLIDASTSMIREASPGRTKLDAARAAAGGFIDGMTLAPDAAGRFDQVAIVAFNNSARVLQPMTTDASALAAALDALPGAVAEGTRLDLALDVGAAAVIDSASRRSENLPVLVLLTDGLPNRVPTPEPSGSQSDTVLSAAVRAKAAGVRIHTIGLGRPDAPDPIDRIDAILLRGVASDPSMYHEAPDASALAAIYARIARVITRVERRPWGSPCG